MLDGCGEVGEVLVVRVAKTMACDKEDIMARRWKEKQGESWRLA